MIFKFRNRENQQALDLACDELLKKDYEYFIAQPDYGFSEIKLNRNVYRYAWWKWQINDELYHYVLQTDQKAGLGFHYKFLSGVKLTKDKMFSKMTITELAEYD